MCPILRVVARVKRDDSKHETEPKTWFLEGAWVPILFSFLNDSLPSAYAFETVLGVGGVGVRRCQRWALGHWGRRRSQGAEKKRGILEDDIPQGLQLREQSFGWQPQ